MSTLVRDSLEVFLLIDTAIVDLIRDAAEHQASHSGPMPASS
jgi:hypothetical protein